MDSDHPVSEGSLDPLSAETLSGNWWSSTEMTSRKVIVAGFPEPTVGDIQSRQLCNGNGQWTVDLKTIRVNLLAETGGVIVWRISSPSADGHIESPGGHDFRDTSMKLILMLKERDPISIRIFDFKFCESP